MSAPKRIICYAINGSGLGHLTRLTAIAQWMRRYVALLDGRVPEVFFLTSSDASDSLAQVGFAAFKIPSKTVAKKTDLNKLEYRRLAKHFVWNTLGVFSPDLFVVDTFPAGSFDELFQVLDGPFKTGFVCRDVKQEYARRATFRSAVGMYDTVIIPHRETPKAATPGEQTGQSTNERSETSSQSRYCGEVIQFEREELLTTEQARHELGVAKTDRLLYVSAGGGGDPDAQRNLTSLVETLQQEPNLHLLVGAGPLYRGDRLTAPRLTWFDASKVWRFFGAVDAAFSAGGYNTFHELLFAQVPTAFFAQHKIADDQARRIEEAVSHGACLRLDDIENPQMIAECVRQLLDPDVRGPMRAACETLIPTNGARRCAIELLRPMYGNSRLEWVAQLLSPRIALSTSRLGEGCHRILSDWLSVLLPLQQQTDNCQLDVTRLVDRLTPKAAAEVVAVLEQDTFGSDKSTFEEQLVKLLDNVTSVNQAMRSESVPAQLADEVLKTLVAAGKKQPPSSEAQASPTSWSCAVMEGVRSLFQLADENVAVTDVLHLYRLFPKIVDCDVEASFRLFSSFYCERRLKNEPFHEIMRQLQVLKMTHPRVTRSSFNSTHERSPT